MNLDAIASKALLYLAQFAQFAQNLSKGHSGKPLSYEWLVVLFFIFAVLLISVSLGRSKMIISLLSVYIAAFIHNHFVYFSYIDKVLKNQPKVYIDISLFIVIYILVYVVVSKIISNARMSGRQSSLLTVLPIAFLQICLLASILIPYIPEADSNRISVLIRPYFETETAQFWWAVIPLVVLLGIRFKKERRF